MSRTILLVDDHNTLRTSLREWLEALFPRCHVVEAASGEEAVAIAGDRPIDLIIMDIGLPDISGIEATRRIKAAGHTAPVVMLTIQEDEAYRADAAEAGAVAYVPKRTMQDQLLPTIQAFLSGASGGKERGAQDEGLA